MESNDWKREFRRLMQLFERESVISLRRIKKYFKESGHPFDDSFKKYFHKLATMSLESSFNTVLFDRIDGASQMTPEARPEAPIAGNENGNSVGGTSDPSRGEKCKVEKRAKPLKTIKLLIESNFTIYNDVPFEIFDSDDEIAGERDETQSIEGATASKSIASPKPNNQEESGMVLISVKCESNDNDDAEPTDLRSTEDDLNKDTHKTPETNGTHSSQSSESVAVDHSKQVPTDHHAIDIMPQPCSRTAEKHQTLQRKRYSMSEQQPHQQQQLNAKRARSTDAASSQSSSFSLENLSHSDTGAHAWTQWMRTKNVGPETSCMQKNSLAMPTDLLKLTADELNDSLSQFVKEIRKPTGSEYAPDTIYYLVLGIQGYLHENERSDNIFIDPCYRGFTECLDEVAGKFAAMFNRARYIVTRVEEKHLWECKQLGAHSPQALLNTLVYFNTKYFKLTTVEQHMQLTFSCIRLAMKPAEERNGLGDVTDAQNVVLQFHPPQSSHIDGSQKEEEVFEQEMNEGNPLRCPVKFYEFYLLNCPKSLIAQNEVFYLLPEQSCTPDSSIWYSTQAMAKETLAKMLNLVKMVKEINEAIWMK